MTGNYNDFRKKLMVLRFYLVEIIVKFANKIMGCPPVR
jgi:hypothetical protein